MFPSFHLTAAPRLSVLKRSQRETLCNACLFSPPKFLPGRHPSRRTTGAGLILKPQRRAPSPLARARVGWLPQVSPSPALGSLCPGTGFLIATSLLSEKCREEVRLGWTLFGWGFLSLSFLNIGGFGELPHPFCLPCSYQ